MQVEGVKYILWAQDMDRAVAFYRDVFGLEVAMQSPFWSELRWGTATIALHGGGTGELQITGLGIQVDDAEAACSAVGEAGGTIRKPPEKREGEPVLLAEVIDPEGNSFAISQYLGS